MTNVPNWIEQDITHADIAAIVQGGCASGAYMPAVTYATAAAVMAEHGDDVLQYLYEASCRLCLLKAHGLALPFTT